MQETQVPFLDQEGPLEKALATHSSILAWRIPWTEDPGGLQSRDQEESDTIEQVSMHTRGFSTPSPEECPKYISTAFQEFTHPVVCGCSACCQ